MKKNPFQILFETQKLIKTQTSLFKSIHDAVDSQSQTFNKEISDFIFTLKQLNQFLYFTIFDPNGMTTSNPLVSSSYMIQDDTDFYQFINQTIEKDAKIQEFHEKCKNSIHDSFSSLQTIFNYLWCDEKITDFLHFLFEASSTEFTTIIQSLVCHPLVLNYFSLCMKPVFYEFMSHSIDENVEILKNNFVKYSNFMPPFLQKILRREEKPYLLFWNNFLYIYIQNPFLFNLSTLDFEYYHKKKWNDFVNKVSSFFSNDEKASLFMKNIIDSQTNKEQIMNFPSFQTYNKIFNNLNEMIFLSRSDLIFLGLIPNDEEEKLPIGLLDDSQIEDKEISEKKTKSPKKKSELEQKFPNLYFKYFQDDSSVVLVQKQSKTQENEKGNQKKDYIDMVIQILNESKLMLVSIPKSSTKAALTQLVELSSPNSSSGPLIDMLDSILSDISKLSIEDLCSSIKEKLSKKETEKAKLIESLSLYKKQSQLMENLSKLVQNIIMNCKVLHIIKNTPLSEYFSFSESPTSPFSLIQEKAKVTIDFHKQNIALLSKISLKERKQTENEEIEQESFQIIEIPVEKQEEINKKCVLIMEKEDLVSNTTDKFVLKVKENQKQLEFFKEQMKLIVPSLSPFEICDIIITAMGWLSNFVFSCGEEEAGADCVVPLTILSISYSKIPYLCSILHLLDDIVIPMHQEQPLFPHTNFFFISTFSCAAGFIVSKAKN